MTEQAKPGFFEKLKTNVKNGWERLMQTRVGVVAEETIAEVHGVMGTGALAIQRGAHNLKNSIANAYDEVSGNIFNKIGNVFKRGIEYFGEKTQQLGSAVHEAVEDLKERYKGLGIKRGAAAMCEDAFAAIGAVYNGARVLLETMKLEDVRERKSDFDKTDPRYDVLNKTVIHMRERRGEFYIKAKYFADKLVTMQKGRDELTKELAKNKKGKNSIVLTTATATA